MNSPEFSRGASPLKATLLSLPDQPSLQLTSSGLPVVAYHQGGNLRILRCGDINCAGSKAFTTFPTVNGGYPSLQLDGSNSPVVSRVASTILTVTRCLNADCTGATDEAPHAQANVVFTSLQLDSGNPVIAYIDKTGGLNALKVMRCNDPNCFDNNESIETIDSGVRLNGISMVLNAGKPVIAYVGSDTTAGPIKIAVCGDTTCSSGNVLALPDPGSGAEWPSITLKPISGYPVVSYYDRNEPTLNVLVCAEVDC